MPESAQGAKLARIWSFDAVSCPGVLRRVRSIFRIVQELICAATRAVPTSSKVFARAACLCKDGLCTTQLDLEILGQLVAVSDRSSNRRLHFFLASSAFTAVLLSSFAAFLLSPCAAFLVSLLLPFSLRFSATRKRRLWTLSWLYGFGSNIL